MTPAPINFAYDFNRDGLVDAVDFVIVRDNPTVTLNGVKAITLPAVLPSSALKAAAERQPMLPSDFDWLDEEDLLLKRTADAEAYPLLIDLVLGKSA